jgi:type VI secretion system protein ImpC
MTRRTILSIEAAGNSRRSDSAAPLRIAVVGAFGGRPAVNAEHAAPSPGKAIPIDIDTFDAVMARLAPSVHLAQVQGTADPLELSFTELDDFHPDSLFERLPLFHDLRILRRRLADPKTFAETAAILKRGEGALPHSPGAIEPSSDENERAMFERLLGAPRREAVKRRNSLDDALDRHLRDLVAPSISPAIGGEQTMLLAAVDDRIAALMRAVLHHPHLQRLEAAWRGLHWLINSIEANGAVAVFLIDADPASLVAAGGLAAPKDGRWSLVVVDRAFGPAAADLTLLSHLGAKSAAMGAALLAPADPALLGCRNLAQSHDPRGWRSLNGEMTQQWQALRRSPAATSIGLVLPRVLLRLPYGARAEPVERFAFEELTGSQDHDRYLWGNPAVAAAILIAWAFQERGWSMTPNDVLELDDLPAHTFVGADGPELKPCAEVYLSDAEAEAVLAQGLMPFLGHRHRNAVRLARFQSIADPPQALAGPWS